MKPIDPAILQRLLDERSQQVALLSRIGEALYGDRWQTQLAKALDRQMRRWVSNGIRGASRAMATGTRGPDAPARRCGPYLPGDGESWDSGTDPPMHRQLAAVGRAPKR
jgi:hypothetical protein